MAQDISSVLSVSWTALSLLLTLFVPGWLLLDVTGLGRRLKYEQTAAGNIAALSVGLSLAALPVVMLWTTTLGLSWSATGLKLFIGLLAGIAVLRLAQRLDKNRLRSNFNWKDLRIRKLWLYVLLFAAIFLGALVLRLVMVRDYAAPAWVDSVHHGLIIRLILEKGKLPLSYEPYFDIQPTDYHPGFHVSAAVFQALSGLSLSTGLLLFGQVLNALAVLAVYVFTLNLTGSWKAGLFSSVLTGFFTTMPAYYASWGRYTELAGLLILPVIPTLLNLESPTKADRRVKVFVSGLASAGLFLVHYRVAAFLLLFLLADLLVKSYQTWQNPGSKVILIVYAQDLGFTGLSAALTSLPWLGPMLLHTFSPRLAPVVGRDLPFFYDFSWKLLTAGPGLFTLVLAGCGLILAFLGRKSFAAVLFLWVLLLFLLANLAPLGLPGGHFVNNTSVTIALFIPISTLGGYLLARGIAAGEMIVLHRWRRVFQITFIVLCILLTAIGAWKLLPILNASTQLAFPGDLTAIAWIQTHLPQDETVLINPFLWGYGVYAGSDGGYWITPLTGLRTMPPPVLYGIASASERQRVIDLSQQVTSYGKDASALRQLMQQEGIRYLYTGVKGGPISPQALQESGLFETVYQQEGVWIFKIP